MSAAELATLVLAPPPESESPLPEEESDPQALSPQARAIPNKGTTACRRSEVLRMTVCLQIGGRCGLRHRTVEIHERLQKPLSCMRIHHFWWSIQKTARA